MSNFYKEIDLSRIVEPYQSGFSQWPWFENSKCVDSEPKRCVGGFSSQEIGDSCLTCAKEVLEPAYESDELINKFSKLQDRYDSRWYLEEIDSQVALACFTFRATAKQVFLERYADMPGMDQWLQSKFGASEVLWLDEIFADKSVRPSGNMNRFEPMVKGFGRELQLGRLAYRTINPIMVRVAQKSFGVSPEQGVPDRREFIDIRMEEQ